MLRYALAFFVLALVAAFQAVTDFHLRRPPDPVVAAPMAARVGETITIKAPSKSGYFNSINVKVYGFLRFKGIERSGIAGMMSVMDIHSFRDLYGYLTPERAAALGTAGYTAALYTARANLAPLPAPSSSPTWSACAARARRRRGSWPWPRAASR